VANRVATIDCSAAFVSQRADAWESVSPSVTDPDLSKRVLAGVAEASDGSIFLG